MLIAADEGRPLPVYGTGENIRDWLFVEDHARALRLVLERGTVGRTYCVGGNAERTNMDVVNTICTHMDSRAPDRGPHARLVTHVTDRPGHDRRYAIDASRIKAELGWEPRESFETGMTATLDWYLANRPWWQGIRQRQYDGQRLGLSA
jgi:dTDP-glucose 4,6-dehydratase